MIYVRSVVVQLPKSESNVIAIETVGRGERIVTVVPLDDGSFEFVLATSNDA